MDKLKQKLLKIYLKLLKAQVNRNWDKARKHHARYLELALKLHRHETTKR
jgi:hypothetical protein